MTSLQGDEDHDSGTESDEDIQDLEDVGQWWELIFKHVCITTAMLDVLI